MASAMEQRESAAIRERDLALAIRETFLSSGSEDVLSPRFQKLDIRSASGSPRTPTRVSGLVGSSSKPQQQKQPEALGLEPGELDETYLKGVREAEFDHHERGVARINNGSFGTCPKSVLRCQEQWMQKWLQHPDAFYFGPLQKCLLESRKVVAAHVHCPVEEVVLVDNVTVAASLVAMDVMWSFVNGEFQKGDSILLLNFTYGAVRNAFQAYAVRAGAHVLRARIPFPVSSSSEILASFEETLKEARSQGRVIRVAVLDHLVSMPSIILPVKELVALCRSYGVEQVFVDGAQAIGNLDINLEEVDADYYTGNLHKWFFAPSTVAFLHCKQKHLSCLHHPIFSHNYGKGLAAECEWVGTRDYSAMLTVPAAFDFMSKIPGGLEAVKAHNHKKVLAAGKMLAEAWGTHCGVAPELCASMVMVALPSALIQNEDEAFALRTRLRHKFSIEVHIFTLPREKEDSPNPNAATTYVRISHQIYNTWDEYLRLRDTINALVMEKSS